MIIVEGTDLVGKTTLCEALIKMLNAADYPHVYQHLSKLPVSFDRVKGYLPLCNKDMVYDRFHLSRQAYGRACQNQEVLSHAEQWWLEGYMRMHCSFTVLVVATDEFITQQYTSKDRDEMYNLNDILAVNHEYHDLKSHADVVIHASAMNWPSDMAGNIADLYLSRREEVDEMGPQIFRAC